MIRHKLCGVGAAMITPFTPEGKVDYQALACMIDYVIEGGVDYIVALGTTAETPTLYMPERAVIAMFITNHIAGRVPLVMGCGGNSTSEVLDQLREFDLRGADAILSVTPYYNKPSQEGLYQHFRTVSEHSPLPVILYNIPGRSGVNMTAETTLRLARGMKNVIGIKEASGDIEQMQHILDRRPEGFIVLSGDDGMTLELMRRGGDGVISVAANAFPKRFMECVNYAKAGEFDRAEKAYECLDEAVHALFEEGNPVGVKCALAEMGIIGPTMRLPLVEGSEALREKFRKLIAEYDLLLLPALAAAKVPVEEDIVAKTSDPDSPFYYTSLMMRYNAGDETLTDEDYHYLYYGYAHQESYKPMEANPDLDKLLMLASGLDPDNPLAETLDAMLYVGEDALARDPFSPKILNLMAYAHGALGNKLQEKMYYNKVKGVLRAIEDSGDALTQKTPRHILMFDHALDVMASEGYTYGKSRIISRTVEFIPFTAPRMVGDKKRKGLYYDFGRVYWNKPEGYTYKRDRTWQFNNLKPRTYK